MPSRMDGLKMDRKGHFRWTERQEQRHIFFKKSGHFSLPLHQPLTEIFPVIKLLESCLWPSPVTSQGAWLSCLHPPFISSPLCACLFLPLVLTLPLVSFETSKMKSLTKVCFQPRSRLSWGLVNNSKHPETRTPLLTDLVLLFFFPFRYLKFKKKLPHHSRQASLYCKNSLSDRHSNSNSAWLTAALQNCTLTEEREEPAIGLILNS